MDTLAWGSLAALASGDAALRKHIEALFHPASLSICAILLLVISPLLTWFFRGFWLGSIGYTLEGAAITVLLLWAVERPNTLFAGFLNSRPLVFIGRLSYSLYLWQEPFLTRYSVAPWTLFPFNLVLSFALGTVSYYAVERPVLRLRRLWSDTTHLSAKN